VIVNDFTNINKTKSYLSLGLHGRDRMVVGFTTNCAISATWRGVIDTTLCDKSLSVTFGRLVVFSRHCGFFHLNKTDHHDITEILLKVALNTTNHKPSPLK
jgi:hypothetical protein